MIDLDLHLPSCHLEERGMGKIILLEQEKWPATKIQSLEKAIVPGIWASTVLKNEPYLDLAKANSAIELIQSSKGSWSRKSDGLAGKITVVPLAIGATEIF